MSISFEQLQEKDIPAMREVIEEELGDFDTEWVKAFLSEEQNFAFVAKLDDVPVGLIYGYSLFCIEVRKPQFFMYSVDIFTDYQNKGYGSRFIEYVLNWARDNGFSETFVFTNKDNLRACKAYENAGMRHSDSDCERMYEIKY